MVEIHVNPKFYTKLSEAWAKSGFVDKNEISIISDSAKESATMLIGNDGNMAEWFPGIDNALSLVSKGYVGIRKKCPFFKRKCIGEKCAHYVVQRNIGDCASVWIAVK